MSVQPITLKVRLGNDFRRCLLVNEEQTYDDFIIMLQRIYPALPRSEPLIIKYQDDGMAWYGMV